ncbi:uncharacterized protein LOC132731061 [Ruditapes philippinarum]|uniref:uncharacterized protein LOC132731061 n=1 Tax=Ruditapes philippinarum TaxID=129788 RepID=UPI00295C134B|nr:uncharacterized protein LOC132731061 [Ruditapes philippinarum]
MLALKNLNVLYLDSSSQKCKDISTMATITFTKSEQRTNKRLRLSQSFIQFQCQPPFYCTPKVPVPTATQVYDVKRKVKFKQNRIQPVPEKPECHVFQSHLSDQRVPEQTEIDGERSQAQYLRVNPELSGESSLALSITASSLSSCSRRGMSDFVILHTDDDLEAAGSFMEHLQRDIGIPDLTVDLLSNIDAGKPGMQSLATLHDNYRYILTYVTKNLESDKYCRYLDEIVLTLGLREANGKEERVVPVLTRRGYCNIIELSILGGLQYFNFRSNSTLMSESYVNCVKNLVKTGRAKFP